MSDVTRMKADVVVVAGGISGLAAAIAAAEKGASVIVFEKGKTLGGTANMGMGFFAVESHIQKRQLISLTVDEAFAIMMEYNHWRGDARLIRKLYEQSASTVKWIEDMGVEFLGAFKYFHKSQATWHIPKTIGASKPGVGSAIVLTRAMADYARELGVKFMLQTPAKKIIIKDGRAAGVRAEKESGEVIEAASNSVIVCTGGFGDNPAKIKEHLGYNHGTDLFSFRIPGLKGDGISMVWEVGGGHSPVNMELTYENPDILMFPTLTETMRQPNLMVNLDGRRFINEEIMNNTPFTGNAINLQKKRCSFSIISDEIIDSYREQGFDFMSYHRGAYDTRDWDKEVHEYFTKGKPAEQMPFEMGLQNEHMFFRSNTLEDMAQQTGINAANLNNTVAEYNQVCSGGGDRLFNKPQRYMKPVSGKQYFAAKFVLSGYGSLGGIKVNDNLQVVTDEGEVIPGLFSAGTDCCSIFGDSYNFYLPGSTMGFALNSGRMAGYNAAAKQE